MFSFEMKPKNEQRPVRNVLVSISFIVFFLTKNGQSVPKTRNENEALDDSISAERFPALSPSSPPKLTTEENLLEPFQRTKTRRSVGLSEVEFRGGRKTLDGVETHPPISKRIWNKFLRSIGLRSHAHPRVQTKFTDAHNELEEGENRKSDLYFKHGKTLFSLENDDPSFDFINFIEYFFGDMKDTGADGAVMLDDVESAKNSEENPSSDIASKSPVPRRKADSDDREPHRHHASTQDLGGELQFLPSSEDDEADWMADRQNLSRKRRQKLSAGEHPKGESFVRRKRRRKHRHRPRTTGSDPSSSNLRKEEAKVSSNNHPEKFLLKSDSPSYVITSASELKKDWCRTVPLRQKVSERNCRPKVIMNNFCYGQCNSFFIPHPGKTGSHSAFQSCAFCKPHRPKWTNVTLHCPGQIPPRKEKRVIVVESCRCITEVFQ